MDWDVFWSVLFVMFVMIPLFMIWAFAIVDLFQRQDLRGIWKVVWLLVILIFPILGTLVYYLVRPRVLPTEGTVYAQAQAGYVAEKLTQLTELKDKGALSPEEYEQQRSRLLST
jgi:hypothetical protein